MTCVVCNLNLVLESEQYKQLKCFHVITIPKGIVTDILVTDILGTGKDKDLGTHHYFSPCLSLGTFLESMDRIQGTTQPLKPDTTGTANKYNFTPCTVHNKQWEQVLGRLKFKLSFHLTGQLQGKLLTQHHALV